MSLQFLIDYWLTLFIGLIFLIPTLIIVKTNSRKKPFHKSISYLNTYIRHIKITVVATKGFGWAYKMLEFSIAIILIKGEPTVA